MMRLFLRRLLVALGLAAAAIIPAQSAGVIPFALTQQFDQNGQPLRGCLLYVYVVGTTATPQQIYSDFGLTQTLPNPLQCDITGRIPPFYLQDGQVHVRLTDSGGVGIVDIPVLQVIGPSVGGGGGGGTVDPNAIASTGDTKWRPTSETLAGWVTLNGQTIGSATSGATGRANNDTQTLFVYLWNNCPNAHCPVSTGRGASGLADFTANKTITLLDMRARFPAGLDQMNAATPAGRILASNITSGGGDGVNTPSATGGESNHTMTVNDLVSHAHTITDPGHIHTVSGTTASQNAQHTHTQGGTFVSGGASVNHSHTQQGTFLSGGQTADHSHTFAGNIAGAPIMGSGSSFGSPNVIGNTGLSSNDHAHNVTISGQTGPPSADHSHNVTISGQTGVESANHAHAFGPTNTISNTTGVSVVAFGSGVPFNVMNPFMLGTWYQKL